MILKPDDAARLISETRSDSTVLIGGQAVAFWIKYFNIQPRLAGLTVDIDYLGTKTDAKHVSNRLKIRHKFKAATFDDNTANSALLLVEMDGYPEPVLIDYMINIFGVESNAIQKSAVTVEFQGEPLRVLHPIQLMQAKIWNLYRLDGKRTPEGIEQARLAIEIVAAFIQQADMSQRDLLNTIEAIGRFAPTQPARFAEETYGLDCQKSIPASVLQEGILPEKFHKIRWPQILANAGRR